MKYFDKGKVVATCCVIGDMELNPKFGAFVMSCLNRHSECDWGDISSSDSKMNDDSLTIGGRLLSAYNIDASFNIGEPKIWVITEADRSATTVLYPSEY